MQFGTSSWKDLGIIVASYVSVVECRATQLCCREPEGPTLRPLVISQTSCYRHGRLSLQVSSFLLLKITIILPELKVKDMQLVRVLVATLLMFCLNK